MATKTIALGSVVKFDDNNDTIFDVVGEIRNATPPPRSYARIADDDLGDVLETQQQGIEEASDFEFLQLWEDGDTAHEKIDTAFSTKTNFAWQIVYPYTTPRTWEFTGRVMEIAPETLEKGNIIARKVTVHRTSAITKT